MITISYEMALFVVFVLVIIYILIYCLNDKEKQLINANKTIESLDAEVWELLQSKIDLSKELQEFKKEI